MNIKIQEKLLHHLLEFVTEKRNALFDEILSFRTRHITIVLEDIYQSQNASAVLRSCDLTGIQDIHIIENKNTYEINPDVALGSSKWLNLFRYNTGDKNTASTLNHLKKQGYRIVATTPHKNDLSLNDIPLNDKIALVFGTELHGLSDIAISQSDEFLRIPMVGFTESYNISVSAALIMYNLTEKLRSSDIDWQLTDQEKIEIKLDWARKTISRSEVIERHFLKKMK